jgi:hypothetical protein
MAALNIEKLLEKQSGNCATNDLFRQAGIISPGTYNNLSTGGGGTAPQGPFLVFRLFLYIESMAR